MNLYLAGSSAFPKILKAYPHTIDFLLESFYYITPWQLEMLRNKKIKTLLLDSGAFTLLQTYSTYSEKYVDEFVQKYIDFINQNDIDLFFELDIDGICGLQKVESIRKRIDKETGKLCIPAWHKSRGLDKFLEIAKDYPYIGIGGIVARKEIKPKEHVHFHKLIEIAHKHGAKIHGLGFTPLKTLNQFNFDSVDSASWIQGAKSGRVFQFRGNSLIEVTKPEGRRRRHASILNSHNFHQWILFQRYLKGVNHV